MAEGPPPPQLCIYCQERTADTVEHVVARCFFGTMPPRCAIKVPACRECNEGRGDGNQRHMTLDEEYVRTIFANEVNSADHPVAKQLLLNEIPRSYDNSIGFLKLIGRNMKLGDAK